MSIEGIKISGRFTYAMITAWTSFRARTSSKPFPSPASSLYKVAEGMSPPRFCADLKDREYTATSLRFAVARIAGYKLLLSLFPMGTTARRPYKVLLFGKDAYDLVNRTFNHIMDVGTNHFRLMRHQSYWMLKIWKGKDLNPEMAKDVKDSKAPVTAI